MDFRNYWTGAFSLMTAGILVHAIYPMPRYYTFGEWIILSLCRGSVAGLIVAVSGIRVVWDSAKYACE